MTQEEKDTFWADRIPPKEAMHYLSSPCHTLCQGEFPQGVFVVTDDTKTTDDPAQVTCFVCAILLRTASAHKVHFAKEDKGYNGKPMDFTICEADYRSDFNQAIKMTKNPTEVTCKMCASLLFFGDKSDYFKNLGPSYQKLVEAK